MAVSMAIEIFINQALLYVYNLPVIFGQARRIKNIM